jgi:glycosyltransferase involved in cell wall biosynthesis
MKIKKALIVDWLDKYGGAERVITSLQNTFQFDEVFSLINIMKPEDVKKIFQSNETSINQTKLKYFKHKFRILFFLFHHHINKIKISEDTELLISSSHAVAKGVKKSSKNQLHISYFQARNFKYIWDDVDLYFGKSYYLLIPVIYLLRKIDRKQANRPDYIIANSKYVQDWIKKIYNRESNVIYPPVDVKTFKLEKNKDDYYVTAGRLVPYKRFDIIINTFNKNGKKIYIIGDGTEKVKLQNISNSNIIFTGYLDSNKINNLISKAKCFIHAGVEDFGIAPVEAQACGTPVIAFGKGGALETIINGKTGLFFKEQTIPSLLEAIHTFETMQFDAKSIRDNALTFSKERFEKEIKEFVEEKYDLFRNKKNIF